MATGEADSREDNVVVVVAAAMTAAGNAPPVAWAVVEVAIVCDGPAGAAIPAVASSSSSYWHWVVVVDPFRHTTVIVACKWAVRRRRAGLTMLAWVVERNRLRHHCGILRQAYPSWSVVVVVVATHPECTRVAVRDSRDGDAEAPDCARRWDCVYHHCFPVPVSIS